MRNIKMVLSVVVLSMVLGGCSAVEGEWPPQEKRKEIILERLEEKYGEKFVIEHFSGPTMFKQWDMVYVYPENGTRETDLFAVRGDIEERRFAQDLYITKDGYFGILIRPRMLELLNEIIGGDYERFYVEIWPNLESSIYPERYTRETTLNDLYMDKESVVYKPEILITICESSLKEEDLPDVLIKIGKQVDSKNVPCRSISLFIVSDKKYEEYLEELKKVEAQSDYIIRN